MTTTLEQLHGELDRRVVEILAELPAWHTMARRTIQHRVYGSDKWGASQTAASLGRLKDRGVVVEVRMHVYRLVPTLSPVDGGTAA